MVGTDYEYFDAVSAGLFHTVGLKADGTVVAGEYNDVGRCMVAGRRLFNSIETIEQACKVTKKAELSRERSAFLTELFNLHGIFAGKRRKVIEARLAEIGRELKTLNILRALAIQSKMRSA